MNVTESWRLEGEGITRLFVLVSSMAYQVSSHGKRALFQTMSCLASYHHFSVSGMSVYESVSSLFHGQVARH